MTDHKPKVATAAEKLAESQLKPIAAKGLQGLGDVDLARLTLKLRGLTGVNVIDQITDAVIERTIEGASTLTITVTDDDLALLQSGRITRGLDTEIDGLFFRIAQSRRLGTNMDLVFEDREVNFLRQQTKKLGPISRKKITRAQFIQRLADEVKSPKIKTHIPELLNPQPVKKKKDLKKWGGDTTSTQAVPKNSGGWDLATSVGLGQNAGLTVKGHPASNIQISNANAILATGSSMGASRKVMVAAIMTAVGESSIMNLSYEQSPGHRRGVYQQDPRYWPASGDVAADAAAFFSAAIGLDKADPQLQYYEIGRDVQHPGSTPIEADRVALAAYGPWRTEAERWVTSFGISGGGATPTGSLLVPSNEAYFFYRGVPPTRASSSWGKETSWDCIQRLASEVQWRAFMVAGVLWYADEEYLLAQKPLMVLEPNTEGLIGTPEFDADENKRYATMTVNCFIKRWLAPPGSVIVMKDYGPMNGRWLVTQTRRSLFNDQGAITLKRPQQALPEPNQGNLPSLTGGFQPPAAAATPSIRAGAMPDQTAVQSAKEILRYFQNGMFRDDNGHQLGQLQKVADAQPLQNQCGQTVWLDSGIVGAILMLLNKGYRIGTFALVEDHHCNDGQHPKGQAVDISSVGDPHSGWRTIGDGDPVTTRVMQEVMLELRPFAWDLLCNGNGSTMANLQELQVDNTKPVSGPVVLADDHTNHIHFGTAHGIRDSSV